MSQSQQMEKTEPSDRVGAKEGTSKDVLDNADAEIQKVFIGESNKKGVDSVSIRDVILTLTAATGRMALLEKILDIMLALNTDEEKQYLIKKRLKNDTTDLTECLCEILSEWRMRAPTECTVNNLVCYLREKNLTQLANLLETKYLISGLR